MMGRSFERDNINFIQTQVRNSFSRNLKDIYIYTEISFTLLKIILLRRYRFSKREILLQKSLNFFTIENIAIWISSLSTNPPRKFDIEGDTSLLCNKLGIGTLRNHFHISSYRSLFHRFLLASNEISFTLLNSRRGYEPSKISQWNWLIKKEIESLYDDGTEYLSNWMFQRFFFFPNRARSIVPFTIERGEQMHEDG